MKEIKYKDLSNWMKFAIVGGMLSMADTFIGFIMGLAAVIFGWI